MSLHSSLKTKSGALNQHRNVLTRAERITKLQDKDGFVAGESSPLGIPIALPPLLGGDRTANRPGQSPVPSPPCQTPSPPRT